MLGSSGGERRNAFAALERLMQNEDVSWTDIGNLIEYDSGCDDGKYTEGEMREFGQAMRAEGVEAGIKIGLTRAAGNGSGNGHLTLPKPAEMAEYCHARAGQLKDEKQREFVSDMHEITQRGRMLSRGRLGYLVSIYIQIGGGI
jgi:hypothetical protein